MPAEATPDAFAATLMRLYDEAELGRDGYPGEWHYTIKHEVRRLAGNRCVRCGHPYVKGSGEWSACDDGCSHGGPDRMTGDLSVREAQWRILTVHHLDGNKANCRWWNLAALCQRCHLTIQGRVRMERVYPWPHSDWFKPYVAGFYAFSYLGEDLDRASVDARLDELLSLELAGV